MRLVHSSIRRSVRLRLTLRHKKTFQHTSFAMPSEERLLQAEIMMRLRFLNPDCVVVPVPNSIYFPARSKEERSVISRIIHQMKASGQIMPGAPDLLCLWRDGAGAIELKRPATRNLLGKQPAGRPSASQIEFAELCSKRGVRHLYATSWDDVKGALADWGRIN